MKIIEFLQGKKSYILAVLMATFALLKGFGVINITPEQNDLIYAVLAALFGISLSAKVARLGKKK